MKKQNPDVTSNNPLLKAMKSIPTPNLNAETVTGLVKEGGSTVGYQLSGGQTLNKQEAITLAKQGGLQGVGISERNGSEYLKSLPDDDEGNNLGNLPSITA